MKKIILILFLIPLCTLAFAGDGDRYIKAYTGWLYRNTLNATIGIEFERSYHNSWELYFDLTNRYRKCPDCNKYTRDSFWYYKTFAVGAAYNYSIWRGKNSTFRLRPGVDLGTNGYVFLLSVEAGFEYNYSFKNNWMISFQQKNEVIFWGRDHIRNGLLIGLKIPF